MPRSKGSSTKGKKKKKFVGLDFKSKDKEEFVPDTQPVLVLEAEKEEDKIDTTNIREKTLEIKDNINKYYTELCQNLWLIQKKQLFKGWGYPSFREYGSKELEFGGTKAIYLASIWNNLAVNQDKLVFDKVMELGWTKGKELARVVTRENLSEWVNKAKHLRVEALVKEIRTFIKKKMPDDPQDALDKEPDVKGTPVEDEKKTITLTFNYEDYLTISQAYENLKEEDPNCSLPQAIAMACRDYLASNVMDAKGKDAAVSIIDRLASVHGLKVSVELPVHEEMEVEAEPIEVQVVEEKSIEETLFES